MNPWRIALVVGWTLLFLAGLMVLSVLVSLFYQDGNVWSSLAAVCITAASGSLLAWFARAKGRGEVSQREAIAIVVLAWLCTAFFGSLPFYFSGEFPSWLDSLFESMSGVTTTGASILASPADLSHGVAFWRCFIQWVGGLGIVLFGLAILPMIGVGGLHLFRAESTGPTSEKITQRLRDTARMLWRIYIGLTALEALLLMICELGPFEAVCHAFTTMATGGFSTRNASAGDFGPAAQLVITLFMFLAGINFALYYRLLLEGKSSLREILRDQELRSFLGLAAIVVVGISASLVLQQDRGVVDALQASAFQVGSLMTATGYASEDFGLWPPVTHALLLLMIMVGGMAGSTAGGIKVIRVRILIETLHATLRRHVHPGLVRLVRYNGRGVSDAIVISIGSFVALYLLFALLGTLVLTLQGTSVIEGFSASITCLSNTGPGLERLGPVTHFGWLPGLSKLTLIALMLIGRLEFFSVLVLFSRMFWRR